MDQLEEILKSSFITFGFRRSHRYRSSWVKQVEEIDEYWEYMMGDVTINDLLDEFELECNQANVQHDPWEIICHMRKAITDWRTELMTEVANRIVQLQCDETEGDFVQWNGHDMSIIYMPDVPER